MLVGNWSYVLISKNEDSLFISCNDKSLMVSIDDNKNIFITSEIDTVTNYEKYISVDDTIEVSNKNIEYLFNIYENKISKKVNEFTKKWI